VDKKTNGIKEKKRHVMVITDAAQDKWMKLMEDLKLDIGDTHLRLAIKGGGCSGFQKKLDYCQTKDIDELDVVTDHGEVKAVVDAKSMLFLHDAVVDYIDGLMGAGFNITIPSAKNSCGCGESFST